MSDSEKDISDKEESDIEESSEKDEDEEESEKENSEEETNEKEEEEESEKETSDKEEESDIEKGESEDDGEISDIVDGDESDEETKKKKKTVSIKEIRIPKKYKSYKKVITRETQTIPYKESRELCKQENKNEVKLYNNCVRKIKEEKLQNNHIHDLYANYYYNTRNLNVYDLLDSYYTSVYKDQIELKNTQIRNYETPIKVEEGTEPCPKCKSKKNFYILKQTRSADEPMTRFYKCLESQCGKEWARNS